MGLTTEILSGGSGISKEVLGGVGGSLAAVGALFKAFVKVETGEMGVKTRFGKVQHHRFGGKKGEVRIVGPGMHPVFPFTHGINKVDVRDHSNNLQEFEVDLPSGQYVVRSSVIWRVSSDGDNPYRALYHISDPDALTQAVTNRCNETIRSAISAIGETAMHHTDQVFEGMQARSAEKLGYYGVELTDLHLHTVAKSIGEKLSTTTFGELSPSLPSRLIASGNLSDLNV